MNAGEKFRAARKRAGLSMSDIARALHVTPQAVRQWEHGDTTPRPERIRELAELLGVTTAYLLGGSHDGDNAETEVQPQLLADDPLDDTAVVLEQVARDMRAAVLRGELSAEDLDIVRRLVQRLRTR
ncbi:MAG: helix-turn-helix transcriptional regulator [Planctomycetes bacterium]|nr:helix-turn-helix transcriptional regulator [Planctomycetota bacterium]HPE79100.1 helix-turn-helix transcriptional regulator [Gammaproteobacteria bacterium]